MDVFDLRKYLAENKLLKEDIKFNDYVEVNQAEFDRLYDRLVDEFDGSVEDFVEEYGRDFLGPNIEAINQYYGNKVYADDVITDFFEAGGVDNISSNEEFEAWLDKNREFYLAENKPIKEDGQWDDKWSPSFDDLKNRAKQIKGFEDMGKYGFSVPYQHGEIEIEPLSISGEMTPFHEERVRITWIYGDGVGNEDSQVSPLSTGYKAVDQAIRSSQDKADWKRMAGL